MTFMDEPVWRGKIHSGARSGRVANLETFTGARWVTAGGDIASYSF